MKKNTDILNKLRYESENANVVHLWLEGMFWKAYERSAYLFVRRISGYKPYKKFVRSVGGEVVAIGFPSKAIEKLLEGRSVEYVDSKHYILNGFTVDAQELKNFQSWKKGIPSFPYHVLSPDEVQQRVEQGEEKKEVKSSEPRSKRVPVKEVQAAGKSGRPEMKHPANVPAYPEQNTVVQHDNYAAFTRADSYESQAVAELMNELRRFRMESSTPLECMMFLAHLIKQSLEMEKN